MIQRVTLLLLIFAASINGAHLIILEEFKASTEINFNEDEFESVVKFNLISKYSRLYFKLPIVQETFYKSDTNYCASLNGAVSLINLSLFYVAITTNTKSIAYVNGTLFTILSLPNLHIAFELIDGHLYLSGGQNLDIFIVNSAVQPIYSVDSTIDVKLSSLSIFGGVKQLLYKSNLYSGNLLIKTGIGYSF